MNELIVPWNTAALQLVIREVEFLHYLSLLCIQFIEHQQDVISEWEQHIWEIL